MKKTVVVLMVFLCAVSALSAAVKAKDGTERPSVALVLSGGGAKGVAHLPIIAELERYGIPIDKVFGTSMGALVGGLYCAGYSPHEMTHIVTDQDLMTMFTSILTSGYNEVLNAFDFTSNNVLSLSLGQGIGGTTGLIDDYMIMNFLVKYIGNVPNDIDFDKDLAIPFECNATDMVTGDEVIFTGGSLLTAMRSSMSIPLAFEPVTTSDGRVFMDGGLVSNYIVHRAQEEGYDIIICVTLNGYKSDAAKAENYTSLSGVAGGTLSVVLANASKGETEIADFLFSPDETMYGVMSFSSIEGILEQSYLEVARQQEKFRQIAALFTEGQKEYKDQLRTSEYYSLYPARTKTTYLSSREALHEDLMGRTRVSLGLYGNGGYNFFFKTEEEPTHLFFPTVSLRAFIKDLGGSNISLDNRIKATIGRTVDVSALALLRLTEDYGERMFTFLRASGALGSLSNFTDRTLSMSLNSFLESQMSADAGFMLTNESSHSVMLYGRAEWISAVPFWPDYTHRIFNFIPSASLEAVFYPDYSIGFFGSSGGRYDMVLSAGWDMSADESGRSPLTYRIAVAGEHNFTLSEKTSVWFDLTGYSARGDLDMRNVYTEYGGWDGMPGYAAGTLYSDFITGGIGLQIELKRGFANRFLSIEIRGGVRSEHKYAFIVGEEFSSMIPFSDSFQAWDLGIAAGLGLGTPVGDIIIGAGFNKDLQLALYLEVT
ncbi:MAG: patatin-like phospholipase family protein [Spirochaetales bacterium]|nr:patatin-like phospholipase family protein [Spirochaetales bacterium]